MINFRYWFERRNIVSVTYDVNHLTFEHINIVNVSYDVLLLNITCIMYRYVVYQPVEYALNHT